MRNFVMGDPDEDEGTEMKQISANQFTTNHKAKALKLKSAFV